MVNEIDVAILGGGPAGISTCLWCHSLGLTSIVLEQERELGGQLLQMEHPVADYPGLPNLSGPQIRDAFEAHFQIVDADVRLGTLDLKVDLNNRNLSFGGESISWRALVVATGARNRTLGVPGEKELIGKGISQSGYRDVALFAGRKVCVIGGGDSAVEDALLCAETGSDVILIHRAAKFRARDSWYSAAVANPRIRIVTETEIESFRKLEDRKIENGGIEITTRGNSAPDLSKFTVGGVFVRLGIQPNTEFLNGLVKLDAAGYVEVDSSQRTSVTGVWAAGDVCRPVCFSIATAAGHGAVAAKSIAAALKENNQPPGS